MSTDDDRRPDGPSAHNRLDAMYAKIEDLQDELEAERERRREYEAELEHEREARERLAERVDEIDGRTDLLRLVEGADTADGEQRAGALLMHCKRTLDATDGAHRIALDHGDAADALHHPDVDRTTIYSDMERAARWVGDADVARYRDGELRVDLSEGGVMAAVRQHLGGDLP